MNLSQVLSPRRGVESSKTADAASQATAEKEHQTEAARPALVPLVDITEDSHGITLLADMPGVSKDSLRVDVDSSVLTIEGSIDLGETDDMRVLHAEVQAPRYRRQFTLSRELDLSQIDASLDQGVLRVRLPKSEAAKPRRIEVRVG